MSTQRFPPDRPKHARFTGALATLWFFMFILLEFVSLFIIAVGLIRLVLVIGWFWWLRRTVGKWEAVGQVS